MAIYVKTCKVCGQKFRTNVTGALGCSVECRKELDRLRSKTHYDTKKKSKSKKKSNDLVTTAQEARAAGMSYGEYVAMRGY